MNLYYWCPEIKIDWPAWKSNVCQAMFAVAALTYFLFLITVFVCMEDNVDLFLINRLVSLSINHAVLTQGNVYRKKNNNSP